MTSEKGETSPPGRGPNVTVRKGAGTMSTAATRAIVGTAILWALSLAVFAQLAHSQSGPAQASPAGSRQDKEPAVVCGFKTLGYTGLCEERTPYEKDKKLEAICKPILDCLNDSRCVKTYCGATTIRKGWTLESAKRDK
jgi:hypothetical protein